MKFALFCLALFVPFAICIINGKDADEDTRFIVSLQADTERFKHFCCGVFITLDFVLTAASCVTNRQTKDIWVVAGTKKLSDNDDQLRLKVDKIFSKEPSGRNKVRNNIALLHIETVIPDSELHKVNTVELAPYGEKHVEQGTLCKLFGWGQTAIDVMEPTDVLQMGPTKITYLTTCRTLLKDVDALNICSGNYVAELCNFDAGGPLISESGNYLLGIATENFKCIHGNYNDVHMRVNSHLDWIWETIETSENAQSLSTSTEAKIHSILIEAIIIVLMKIWYSI